KMDHKREETISPVDLIEEWRRKASNFSSTDRIGNIISRSLEVLKGLVRKEISFPDLEYALESLDLERKLALKHDKAKDTDEVRSLMYGVIESIGVAVNTMISLERIRQGEERAVEDPLMPQRSESTSRPSTSMEHRDEETMPRQKTPIDNTKTTAAPSTTYSIALPTPSAALHSHHTVPSTIPSTVLRRSEDRLVPHVFAAGDNFRLPVPPTSTDSLVKGEQELPMFQPDIQIKEEEVFIDEQMEPTYQNDAMGNGASSSGGWNAFSPPLDQPSTSRMTYPTGIPMGYGSTVMPMRRGFDQSMESPEMYGGMYAQQPPGDQNGQQQPLIADRPFACDECNRSFASLKWLQNHKKTHQELREDRSRFMCMICGQRFTDRSNQRRHIRRQHELNCVPCNEKFDNKSEMENHNRNVHGMRAEMPIAYPTA
ncbi:hypothetical protein PMAYCL1PPCAC_08524, partial [Pristionchus mayeri]